MDIDSHVVKISLLECAYLMMYALTDDTISVHVIYVIYSLYLFNS